MADNIILREDKDGIVILTINRPKALNALNNDVFEELNRLFTGAIRASEVKGVIITGAGEKAFVAGADIKEFLALDQDTAERLSKRGHDVFNTIEAFPKPVIAAINGFALGGGCELAMACHMRIAGSNAKFGQPEVNLGILPGYGATQRLPLLIGRGKALELMLTADMIDAIEAHSLGLVNHVTEPGEEVNTAVKIIQKIAKKAPLAVGDVIRTINACYNKTEDGYGEEIRSFGKLAASEDFKEGASAFIEKRKASFRGK